MRWALGVLLACALQLALAFLPVEQHVQHPTGAQTLAAFTGQRKLSKTYQVLSHTISGLWHFDVNSCRDIWMVDRGGGKSTRRRRALRMFLKP